MNGIDSGKCSDSNNTELRLVKLDPDKGYYGRQLWIPKKHINPRSIKAGLEFPVMTDTGVEFMQLWEENATHIIVPREFIPRSQYKDAPFQIIDIGPTKYTKIKFKSKIVLDFLRPEENVQRRAHKAMSEIDGGILNLACGRGKTQIALQVIADKGVPAIVIVNNTTLIDQWKERIEKFLDVEGGVGVVQGDPSKWDWKERGIVLAMINTLAIRYEQLPEKFDRYFGGVYYDECFIAGTPIGGVPIEKIVPGDIVPSYDEGTHIFVDKKVIGVTRRKTKCLVKINVEGAAYYCTIPHPFLTATGWVKAGNLTAGDYIKGTKNEQHIYNMHYMPKGHNTGSEKQDRPLQKIRESLLFTNMLYGVPSKNILINNAQDEYTEIRHPLRENEKEQSYVRPEDKKSYTKEAKEHGFTPTSTGWKWISRPNGTEDLVRCSTITAKRLVPGVHSAYTQTSSQGGLSNTLQTRHSLPIENDKCGGRWSVPLGQEGPRCEKRRATKWFRVDSVEVYEQGSDSEFGEVCPDGYVYNLEVEDTHTYLVNGLVVHNCHHLSAPLFIHTAPMFYGNRYGLTATVNREDGLEPIYQYHIGPVFFRDLAQDVKPRIYLQEVPITIDLRDPEVASRVYDTRGKLNIPKLRTYLGTLPANNQFIADKLQLPVSKGRKILALSHSVDQLRALHLMFPDSGLCTGDEKPAARIETLKAKQITFGTLQLVKEALDEKTLDTVFFLTPFGSGAIDMGGKNTLQQGMGRILGYRGGGNHPVVVILDHVFIPKFHKMCRQLKKLINEWPVDEGGPFEYTILRPFDELERYKK